MKKTILLIDGDLIAYRNAAAGEDRKIVVTHKSGSIKGFKNRTEFKKFLKDKKKYNYNENDFTIEDVQIAPDPVLNFNLVNTLIGKIEDKVWADKTEVYLGFGPVFRHQLDLPSPYKDNRSEVIKPANLEMVREYMKHRHAAEVITGVEADDMLSIRAYEELAKGNIPIIASIDKDTYQASGVHVLNWLDTSLKMYKIPDLGHLRIQDTGKSKAIKGDGLKFLAYQVLAGDPVDTYQPYELSNQPYGPMQAFNAIIDLPTEQDVLRKIISEYKYLYPQPVEYVDCHGDRHAKNWKEFLEMYWMCAFMMRHRNDECNANEFFESKGVKIE